MKTIADSSGAWRTRVLVVDDDQDMRELLRSFLAGEEFVVTAAAGGQQALAMIRESAPDLVVLDVLMPDMSGHQVVSKIKADPKTKNIMIIMVSGLKDPTARLLALDAGADAFLTKPIERAELRTRVRDLVRSRASRA